MTTPIGPDSNELLGEMLDMVGVAELAPQLERVRLRTGQVLHEPDAPMQHVYFPVSSLVSLLQVMRSGHATETAVIGNDGMLGAELMMGGGVTPNRAVVQCEGHAYRLGIELFTRLLDASPPMQQRVLAYARTLMVQTAQTAACNRHHALSQQLCRWLLLSLDRLPEDELRMTHETLANMLGVRRESVTLAASKLRDEGAITYSRGRIRVVDRKRLEVGACECYALVHSQCHGMGTQTPRVRLGRVSVFNRTEPAAPVVQIVRVSRPETATDGHRYAPDRRGSSGDRRRGAKRSEFGAAAQRERRLAADRRRRTVSVAFSERRGGHERRAQAATLRAGTVGQPAARTTAGG